MNSRMRIPTQKKVSDCNRGLFGEIYCIRDIMESVFQTSSGQITCIRSLPFLEVLGNGNANQYPMH
jgi:hypothetical protein